MLKVSKRMAAGISGTESERSPKPQASSCRYRSAESGERRASRVHPLLDMCPALS